MHEGSITIRLPADLKEIQRLNRLVRQFGELHDVPDRALYAVNLAMDELVSNVILYGYPEPAGQEITAGLEVRGSDLFATLEDSGRAFDPHTAPPPNLDAPLQERTVGGLGIHLVRSLMDGMEYRREGEKNVLTLRKRIR